MELLCGIDEAGRGPIAGPVCAAAVVLSPNFPIDLLNDSKKLNESQRLKLEQIIKDEAIAWAIGWANRKEIDEVNILQATMHAMERSYKRIARSGLQISSVVVDGNRSPSIDVPCFAVIKGDATIPQIMAASILAKTARDRLMMLLSKRYPLWGFESHKGYPTKAHKAACRLYGPSPIQRYSFTY
ncbi:MAG: ribonuclease HII [Sphaerochaetaceae bacterium]|jgi:ribonuclease HII|nr:ribonuclease HII [Sphaerochaetaceae bacterium]MDD3669827.1 ribonuclease HII [Sphaerochaetaceae bacterium]MDX9935019.1 ribonuclease HII [Sphaerochaetaceae bacterium]NLO61278.1 ribonuclease HII [Spirochaetales bacterium]